MMSSLEISFQEFEELVVARPCIVYVSAKIVTETTPLTAYAALIDGVKNSYSFLLESGEKNAHSASNGDQKSNRIKEHTQYSFIGYDPEAIVTIGHEGVHVGESNINGRGRCTGHFRGSNSQISFGGVSGDESAATFRRNSRFFVI